MFLSTATIISWLMIYKYGILFLLVCVEGPLVTMAAGFLAAHGYMNIWLAFVITVVADVASDSVYFFIGYWGRLKLVSKYERFFGMSLARVERLEKLFEKRTASTLIIAKITHVAGLPFILAAGLAKVRYYKFLLYDTIATLPKSLAFLLIGFYFGMAFNTINRYLEYGTIISAILVIAYIVGYVYMGKYFDKKI